MYCKVSVDMLNPITRVKELQTLTAYGEVTNVLGYLSTNGFPNHESSLDTTEGGNPELCAGGLRCCEDNLDGDTFFYPNQKLTAFGTKYSEDYSSYSSKYGSKVASETKFADGYCSQTWEFSPEQGNGEIRSLFLTNWLSAHAFDNDNFLDSASIANGSDFAFISQSYSDIRYCRVDSSYNFGCYITDNYVVILKVESKNVQVSSDYVTTITYKRIPRELASRYFELTAGMIKNSPISCLSDAYASAPNYWEGTLEINTGVNKVIVMTDNDQNIFQDRFAFGLISCSDSRNIDGAPITGGSEPYISGYNTNYWNGRVKLDTMWVISGDTPAISTYTCPYGINAFVEPGLGFSVTPTIILKDFSIMYIYNYSGNYRFVHRKLSDGSLIYDEQLDSFKFLQMPFIGKGIYGISGVDRNGAYQISKTKYYDITTHELIGYGINYSGQTSYYFLNPAGERFPRSLYFYNESNPFFLSVVANGVGYRIGLRTNYVLARCNLRTPIIKTSDYIMRVTFELFLED